MRLARRAVRLARRLRKGLAGPKIAAFGAKTALFPCFSMLFRALGDLLSRFSHLSRPFRAHLLFT